MIRTLWLVLHMVLATVPLGMVCIIAFAFGVRGDIYYKTSRLWARWLLWAANTPVRIYGVEHIALDAPQIIAANHVSWFDVIALAAYLPKRNRFIAKKELKNIPIFGWAWQAAGHIAIDRSNTTRAIESLDLAARLVREDNSCIVIFPEGTRSETEEMLPFKKGAFMLALHAGLDFVPTGVQGTRTILPKHSWRVRPRTIIVRFGPPIHTSAYGENDRDALMSRVRTEIDRLRNTPPDDKNEHVGHH